MSTKSETLELESEFNRMTNKIHTVLQTSLKANDMPSDILSGRSEAPDGHQGIQAVTDFRVTINGIEQYLVSWHSNLHEKSWEKWESEKTVEATCKDALLKYWLRIVFSNRNEDVSNMSLFTQKLQHWMQQPITKVEADDKDRLQSAVMLPKKRPRLDDELLKEDCLTETERKLPKLTEGTNENVPETKVFADYPGDKELQYLSEYPSILYPEEIFNLMNGSHYELGEVIHCSKGGSDSTAQPTTFYVKWFYISNETAGSLGLKEEDLLEHFEHSTLSENDDTGRKFHLCRTKHGHAEIREVQTGKKSRSPGSGSDSSDNSVSSNLSTVPPSELGSAGFDLAEYSKILDDNLIEVGCQTGIELDPFACLYCQSRKGEEDRLSSLRQRRSNKKQEEEQKSESRTNEKQVAKPPPTQNGDEEEEDDDDDMVFIEYEIEKILDYRKVEGTNTDQYYIRWKGFTAQDDTWEPPENLSNCDKALVVFHVDRVAERIKVEAEMQKLASSGNGAAARRLVMPALPPIPEVLMEKLSSAAPVSDEDIQNAYKVLKTLRKNARWTKKKLTKLRRMLLDLIGESGNNVAPWSAAAAQDELPVIRHQLLMLEAERRKELILKDLKEWEVQLSNTARGRPEIVVENTVDLVGPPSEFKYINDNVLGDGVTFPEDPQEGCHCEDSCAKDKSQCCPGKHGKQLAYNIYKRIRVYPGYPIYECNKHCKCGPECINRVVQDGTMSLLGTKLCIFRTKNERGWGVKTLKKIKRGSFVCLYAGEIITSEEAESRGKIYENQLGASYLFDLDYYAGDDHLCPYTIDATKMGNIAHFINHSCEPNLCVFNVWADCLDQNLPKLAFFALRDIEKDEELTYDYGTNDDDPITGTPLKAPPPLPVMNLPEEDYGEDSEENAMLPVLSSPTKNRLKLATSSGARRPCLCGASTCRKVLF